MVFQKNVVAMYCKQVVLNEDLEYDSKDHGLAVYILENKVKVRLLRYGKELFKFTFNPVFDSRGKLIQLAAYPN